MRGDQVDAFLKALNERNGRAEATLLIFTVGFKGKLSQAERDELLTCSRIAKAKVQSNG